MRNDDLVYLGGDFDVVWDTVTHELPSLVEELTRIARTFPKNWCDFRVAH